MADRLERLGQVVRLGTRAAHALAQQPACRQGVVADHLGGKPVARRSRQQQIFRVTRLERRACLARLLIRCGHDDLLE